MIFGAVCDFFYGLIFMFLNIGFFFLRDFCFPVFSYIHIMYSFSLIYFTTCCNLPFEMFCAPAVADAERKTVGLKCEVCFKKEGRGSS